MPEFTREGTFCHASLFRKDSIQRLGLVCVGQRQLGRSGQATGHRAVRRPGRRVERPTSVSGDCKPPDVCKGCTEALPWEYPSQYKVAQDSYFKQHGFPSHCETQDGMNGYETWEPSVSDKHTIEEKFERAFEGLGKKLQKWLGTS